MSVLVAHQARHGGVDLNALLPKLVTYQAKASFGTTNGQATTIKFSFCYKGRVVKVNIRPKYTQFYVAKGASFEDASMDAKEIVAKFNQILAGVDTEFSVDANQLTVIGINVTRKYTLDGFGFDFESLTATLILNGYVFKRMNERNGSMVFEKARVKGSLVCYLTGNAQFMGIPNMAMVEEVTGIIAGSANLFVTRVSRGKKKRRSPEEDPLDPDDVAEELLWMLGAEEEIDSVVADELALELYEALCSAESDHTHVTREQEPVESVNKRGKLLPEVSLPEPTGDLAPPVPPA